jgi:predicted secreted protein
MARLAPLLAALMLTACAATPQAPAAALPAPAPVAVPAVASPPHVPAPASNAGTARAPATTANVDIDNAADGTRVTVRRGAELKVIIDANATTGFQWQGPPAVAPVLSPIGERVYVGKAADPRFVGAGGMNIFRFRGEQPGKVTLQFEYRRSWETLPPARTLRYEVTVE